LSKDANAIISSFADAELLKANPKGNIFAVSYRLILIGEIKP
jgi:hypothetical protein